jgi:hypothetical protein
MDQQLQRRQTGEIQAPVATITQGFGTQEVAMRGERSSDAVAARETAAVQARFVVAIQRPRDTMDFRSKLLHECKRPGFAEVAMFKRPVGKVKKGNEWVENFAEGPSIRMIETCLQLYRNVQATSTTVYDGPDLRIIKVMVIDFENNISFEQEVNVPKTVEKRAAQDYKTKEWGPPKGREILGQRINSDGDITYLVAATDDEVTIKQAAMVSKAMRTCGQRLLPRDVIEEAIAQIRATKMVEVKQDPDAAKKRVADAFADLGVLPSDIGAYLGHSIDRATASEIVKLREIYSAIKDGESRWEDFVENANTTPDPALQEDVRARLVAEAEAKKAAAKPPATAEPKTVTVTQPEGNEPSDAAEPPVDDLGASRYEQPTTTTTQPRRGFTK